MRTKSQRNATLSNLFSKIIIVLIIGCSISIATSFWLFIRLHTISHQFSNSSTEFENNKNSIDFSDTQNKINNSIDFSDTQKIINSSIDFSDTQNSVNNSISNQIQSIVQFSLSSYSNNCLNSDEIRPISNQCLNNFGFQSTLIESLETLYLLNLTKTFQTTSNHIFNEKKLLKSPTFRKDIFERLIASLIGTFLLTNEKKYLKLATKITDSILQIDSKSYFPFPIIDFQLEKGFIREWENGTSIIDIISGLPEILSLYRLTNDSKYLDYSKNLLNKLYKSNLNDQALNNLYIYYNNQNGKNTSQLFRFITTFYEVNEILLRSLFIVDLQEIRQFINPSNFHDKYENVYYDSFYFSENQNEIQFSIQAFDSLFENEFSFDSLDVRTQIRKMSISTNDKYQEQIEEVVSHLLNSTIKNCQVKNGFSGLSKSNNGKIRQNNIQHSAFLGNWLNTLSQALWLNQTHWKHALYNTRGHLICL